MSGGPSVPSMTHLRVLSSMATKPLLTELLVAGRLDGMPDAVLASAGGVDVANRVRSGEAADFVVLAAPAIDGLVGDGLLDGDTVTPLVVSSVVVAVRSGAARPDIGTVDALRSALGGGGRIGYSTGPSGDGLLALLGQWGMRHELEDRLVRAQPGTPVGQLIADGLVDLGMQQRSELQDAPGVTVLGPMPAGAEIDTVFTGAVLRSSSRPDDARRAIGILGGDRAATIARRYGFSVPR